MYIYIYIHLRKRPMHIYSYAVIQFDTSNPKLRYLYIYILYSPSFVEIKSLCDLPSDMAITWRVSLPEFAPKFMDGVNHWN